MRLLGDILQIAIYTSIQIPSEKALFIILLFVIYEVKKQTKKEVWSIISASRVTDRMNQEIINLFHIVSTLPDRVQTFLCKYANMAKKWQQCRFNGSSCKKSPQPSYIALFLSLYCLFEQRWNFPILKGLRSCSNVQKKNLRSSEKSRGAFLMSVVLPEYLMRLTPEKTW